MVDNDNVIWMFRLLYSFPMAFDSGEENAVAVPEYPPPLGRALDFEVAWIPESGAESPLGTSGIGLLQGIAALGEDPTCLGPAQRNSWRSFRRRWARISSRNDSP